jgi:hypothetical protein
MQAIVEKEMNKRKRSMKCRLENQWHLKRLRKAEWLSRFEAPSCQVRRRSKHTKLVIYRFDLGAPTAFVAVGKATPTIV